MPQYRTEVIIAEDRYVCLQLPAHLPKGRALVTVMVVSSEDLDDPGPAPDLDHDRQDIEWWDELDQDRERAD